MFPIAKKLNTHTEIGQIQKYLQEKELGLGDNYELSPALELKLERVEFVKKMLPELIEEAAISKKLREQFGISKAQSYIDIHDAKMLFGEQQIWADCIFKELKETRKVCLLKNDTKGLNSNDKNKIEAVAKFKGDKQTEVFKSWTPPQVIIIREAAPVHNIDPVELEKEIKLLLKPKGGKQELDFDDAEVLQ